VTLTRNQGIALTLLTGLVLAGCGSSDTTAGDSGVEVSVDLDSAPEITVPDGDPPSDLVVETVVEGDGEPVEAGDLLVVEYSGLLWDTGEEFDSSWSRGEPAGFAIGTGEVIQGWDDGLVDQDAGSRVLLVIPPELGYADQESETIPANSTLVFTVDILDSYSAEDMPEGTEAADLPDNLPTLSGPAGEQPELDVDGFEPPETSESVVVVEGSGDPIEPGSTLVAHALQASATTGEVLFTTWDSAPLALQAEALPGLAEALDGASAGTRTLTLVSAEDNGGEPGVLVVDVIASY
jgi:peptidylprolyl isomerase